MVTGEGGLLFSLLAICTVMLYRQVRQQRRQMKRMESFIAAVSHEMKTPLTGIKSMLQTFADGGVPETSGTRLYAMGLKEARAPGAHHRECPAHRPAAGGALETQVGAGGAAHGARSLRRAPAADAGRSARSR